QLGVRIDALQRLPDPRDITDAAQRVLRHPDRLALLPFVECPLGREAENPAGAIVVHAPALHHAEEALDGPALLVGGHPLDHGGGKGGHLHFSVFAVYTVETADMQSRLRSQELAMADKPAPRSATSPADPGTPRAAHPPIYYAPAPPRARAARLREQVAAAFPEATLGRWHDELVGPHTQSMYQIAFPRAMLASFLPWLMLNRDGLTILLHPGTGDDHADHSEHAVWFGAVLPLRLHVLKGAPKA